MLDKGVRVKAGEQVMCVSMRKRGRYMYVYV